MFSNTFTRLVSVLVIACGVTGCAGEYAMGDSVEAHAAPREGMLGRMVAPAGSPAPSDSWGAEKSSAVSEPAAQPRPDGRLRIYSGTISVHVPDVEETIGHAIARVEGEGGFLQSRDGDILVFRVPAARFHATLADFAKYGTVTHRAEQTEDVTRQHEDLQLRLENARESRGRLLALLAKATDTKALLEIEQELRRLTDEIERFELDLKNLDHQIAYSRLQLILSAFVYSGDDGTKRAGLFPWFDRVGVDATLAAAKNVQPALGAWFDIFGSDPEIPQGFLVVSAPAGRVHAIAADESVYRSFTLEDSPQGDIDFWCAALLADFEERRGYTVVSKRRVTTEPGEACEFVVEGIGDGRARKYLVLLAVEDGRFADTLHLTELVTLPEPFEVRAAEVRRVAGIVAK
jgi:Domain of unknown function (DUF4349)